ncbi:MAG: hypothetical protein ACYCZW_00205 [Minisyncoccota bacterium]
MLEFNIKDVPFFHLSDEIPFFNGSLPSLSSFVNIEYAKLLVLILLFLYLIGYIIISVIVFYHWNTYGMKTKMILLAKSTFTLVSLAFFVFLFSITLSL